MITLGNHTWRRSEINSYLADVRARDPARELLASSRPAAGLTVAAAEDGTKVAVINVMGSLFLSPAVAMFEVIDEFVDEARVHAEGGVLVDFHAEATSEKVALACRRRRPCHLAVVSRTRMCRRKSDVQVLPAAAL